MFRGNETVTVVRRSAGSVDEYGIPTQTETTDSIANCLIEFDTTGEPVSADSDPIIQAGVLYIPLGADVDEVDEFVVRGQAWVKDGAVIDWQSPFSRPIRYSMIKIRRRLA